LLALALGGCQSLDKSAPADWIMKGRIIVTTPESSQRLSIYWRQDQQNFEILLNGTLGTSVARLVSEDNIHYIDVPGEVRRFSASPDALLFETTGLDLPVATLIPVLSGLKPPGRYEGWQVSILESDKQGRPLQLNVVGADIQIRLTATEWQ
jgi:outer membrane lipoprotein LolB